MNSDRRCVRLNEAFVYVDDTFLDIVECEKRGGRHRRNKSLRVLGGAVAASICLFLVMPVAAIAYQWLGLRDILLMEKPKEYEAFVLSDYQEMPEIQALVEWTEFLSEYDTNQKIQSAAAEGEFPTITRKDWLLYGVYSLEMGAKLDKITEQYKLKLHSDRNVTSLEVLESVTFGKFMDDIYAKDVFIYEDDSFLFEGSTELKGCRTVEFQFVYNRKGTFNQDMSIIGSSEEYTQWQYVSACGEVVLLASNAFEDLILVDFEGALIVITVPNQRESGLTKADLEELADKFDFGVLKSADIVYQNKCSDSLVGDMVTLSGYQDSPEAKALAEWTEFLESYDLASAIGTGNSIFVAEGRKDWSLYSVYSYEMGERLDEIVNKYGLRLYSERNVVNMEEMEYRVGGKFLAGCDMNWGYIYEDGTFHIDGSVILNECGIASFEIGRAVKGTFGEFLLNIGKVENYTEWRYLTACKQTALLALGTDKALIFADFDDCFVYVNILCGRNEGLTSEEVQKLADAIDFGILKNVQIPDMRGDVGIVH